MNSRKRDVIVGWATLIGICLTVAAVAFVWSSRREKVARQEPPPRPEVKEALEYLRSAKEAADAGSFRAARKLADTALKLDTTLFDAAVLAGESAIEFKDFEMAIDYFDRVPPESRLTIDALFGIARANFLSGMHDPAEKTLRDALKLSPYDSPANDLLAELLDVQGRRTESSKYALEVARQGHSSLEALMLLADPEFVLSPNRRAKSALEKTPNHGGLKLGLARAAFDEGNNERGLALVRKAIEAAPALVEAKLLLGQHLLDSDEAEFLKWHESLSKNAERFATTWFLRGQWADRHNQAEAAMRCFWETLTRSPEHRAAHFQLAKLLRSSNPDAARQILNRGLQLTRLKKALEPIVAVGNEATDDELYDVVVALESLDRQVEARAWEAYARRDDNDFQFASIAPPSDSVGRYDPPLELFASDTRGLSSNPLPTMKLNSLDEQQSSTGYTTRFEDQASSLGLNFAFIPAPDETTGGKRIIELTGGGVAALDFDLDAWPDMFFSQGGLVPQSGESQATDRLFRNMTDRFEDVTTVAGLGGSDYGQGMAVGDFNSDGFPDVFVGNLGQNRLFANNGDGTFTDVTQLIPGDHSDWTTSCVFADFSGDGLPDLYVANYLQGDDLADRICQLNETTKPRMCTPDQFEAAQDRVYLNLGDGRLEDRTAHSGIHVPQGKGLGLLAARFGVETGELHSDKIASRRAQLLVANDGVANFFFDVDPQSFSFRESAAAAGIAMSGDGLAQACMGIAAGDANMDGQLDVFVTNFDREPNSLYLGNASFFEDATRQTRLHDPSFRLLGFGTQFVDGDLDGCPDLIVTNGHVDDYSHQGTLYRMRPQYFQNDGSGSYAELFADNVGDFFEKPALGRSMCRIDWNRDGREDIAISHLDTPASLLTNVASRTGKSISFKLVGTNSDRDATTTIVRLTNGDWKRSRQLVAGDGYQCSNEKKLVFGIAERATVNVTIDWPDGSNQTFKDISTGREYLIRQGDQALRTIPY